MARIDKTYGTKAQSQQMYDWLARHRPKFLRFHYGVDEYDHLDDDEYRPIVNTPTSADKWLARHCPLAFVLERICEVYNENHVAAKCAAEQLEGTDPQKQHWMKEGVL